jgi:IS6 family transposase
MPLSTASPRGPSGTIVLSGRLVARPFRRRVGGRWIVEETFVKVAGQRRYGHRTVDQHGQVFNVFVSDRRNMEQYANNKVECDHGRLKARLRPVRGLKTDRSASVVIRG